MRSLLCAVTVAVVAVLGLPGVPAAAEAGPYAPPVDGEVVDGWRPPAHDYGAGNRGIDYRTERGEEVRAAADGEVVFAGRVGGSRHVVVLHPDGIRTSYSFLDEVLVARGDQVVRGEAVGRTGSSLHFGARAGDRYIDPTLLLGDGAALVHLVPLGPHRRGSEDEERRGLLGALGAAVGAGIRATGAGVAWARGAGEDAAAAVAAGLALAGAAAELGWEHLRRELEELWVAMEVLGHYTHLPLEALELWRRARWFHRDQEGCTPPERAPPPREGGRRIAVLVGGFGSASGHAAILDLDTASLGYGPGDVAQFSYAGGQAPGTRQVDGVPVREYGPEESADDIDLAAERLRDLLHAVRAAHPGVPVDLIAHSQGGLVVRAALGGPADALDPRLPPVEHVITLGSPHHGADVATAGALLATTTPGGLAGVGVALASDGGVLPHSVAAGQLAETSSFIAELAGRPLPRGARVTSIAARGDLVVPALQSGLRDAANVVVPLDGLSAHDRLPGSAEAQREIALALAGLGPTCRRIGNDLRLAGGISVAEDIIGGTLGAGAVLLDLRLPSPSMIPAVPGTPGP
jgi:hypothetical protein